MQRGDYSKPHRQKRHVPPSACFSTKQKPSDQHILGTWKITPELTQSHAIPMDARRHRNQLPPLPLHRPPQAGLNLQVLRRKNPEEGVQKKNSIGSGTFIWIQLAGFQPWGPPGVRGFVYINAITPPPGLPWVGSSALQNGWGLNPKAKCEPLC